MQTGKTLFEDEGRDWMMHLQVKECQGLSAKHRKLGERLRTDFPSLLSEGTNPADILILDFWPLDL